MDVLNGLAASVGMSAPQLLATGGAACGFLGGLLLAYAASDELRAHRLAILALQVETTALVQASVNATSPVVAVGGTDKHIERGVALNKWLTRLGVFLLAASLIATLASLIVSASG